MRPIIEVIKTPAFIEKILLLLVTAILTGILVPEISARLSEVRYRDQKLFEAELQRQKDVISAQSDLLKNLSRLLWEFQLMNINVSFYKNMGNKAEYSKAVLKYQNRSAELLGLIRAELSTSKRLASPLMQSNLSDLYFKTILPVDSNLELLISAGEKASANDWRKQHEDSFNNAQKQIEYSLKELADEFRLSAPITNKQGA